MAAALGPWALAPPATSLPDVLPQPRRSFQPGSRWPRDGTQYGAVGARLQPQSHRDCIQGLQRGSPGRGPQGIRGRRQGPGDITVPGASMILSPAIQGAALTSGYSHPRATCPLSPQGHVDSPAGPTAPSTAPVSPFRDTQDPLHLPELVHDPGPCCGARDHAAAHGADVVHGAETVHEADAVHGADAVHRAGAGS